MTSPKTLDVQAIIAEVEARLPSAARFDLRAQVVGELAWAALKRGEDDENVRALFDYNILPDIGSQEDRIKLLRLYAQALDGPVNSSDLRAKAKAVFQTIRDRKREAEEKTRFSRLFEFRGESAHLTTAGRIEVEYWKDAATKAALWYKPEYRSFVLDTRDGPLAPAMRAGEKKAKAIYASWPKTPFKGAQKSLEELDRDLPFTYKGQDYVASGTYLMALPVYEKLKKGRVDPFSPVFILGEDRKNNEVIREVLPSEETIQVVLQRGSRPIRGLTPEEDVLDLGVPGMGLASSFIGLLQIAGYTRFQFYRGSEYDRDSLFIVTDADTGQILMLAMGDRMPLPEHRVHF